MPHFSAPAALALAKALRPDVPFIVVSGELDLNLAVSLMKGGAQDYIQKQELARLGPAIARELREVEVRRARQRAEAVAPNEAHDSPFSRRSDAAGSHTAAEEGRPHDQHHHRGSSHGMRRLDGVEPLALLAHADQATAVGGDRPRDARA
jgi:hypothetical protein